MEIIFATENVGKHREISNILDKHKILLPKDLGLDYDFEETGTSYFENAFGKALALHKLTDKPVIADDSGLSVLALDGAPGLYSARYGMEELGIKLSDSDKNNYLLEKMQNIKNRKAFFVSNIVYMTSPYRFFSFQETIEGEITYKPVGENGFGYDPVFFLKEYNKTIAQIDLELKNQISHRGKACNKLKELLKFE